MTDDSEDRLRALEQELHFERRARQALVEASVRLNSLLSLPELLSVVMQTATDLLEAETSSLMLLDESGRELTFAVATGEPGQAVREQRVPSDKGIAGWVLGHGEPAIVDDVPGDARFYEAIDRGSDFQTHTMLAVPLKVRERTIGVVEVINKRGQRRFDARDRELATALAALAAGAIENARLYRKLADAVVESRMSYRL